MRWLGLRCAAFGACGLDLGIDLFLAHRLDVGPMQALGHLHQPAAGLAVAPVRLAN
jgi:hypothetical protein